MRTLKQRTHHAHRELEDRLDLLSPALDLGRYGRLLQGFATMHAPLEDAIGRQLEAQPDAGLDIDARRKVPALRADLDALGLAFPAPGAVIAFDLRAAALGALYVTEGATLGGTLIAGHLERTFGPAVPHAFFSSYGRDVPARWAEYRHAARRLLRTREDVETAADAAVATFARFRQALAP
ncbi:MAG: biliverdin-producing heme oxygenase [Ilumatobacteraceae bacterium]